MRRAMLDWGAIELECPRCHHPTLIYPETILGGNKYVRCQKCGAELQYKDGQAVFAVKGGATTEELNQAEQEGLRAIAHTARFRYGIPKEKLRAKLKDVLPEEA